MPAKAAVATGKYRGGVRRRNVSGALRLLAASALAAAALAHPPVQAQAPKTKVTLTMGGDGFQFLTQHIALRGGFMAQEGLDAQTIDVGSGPRQVAALMGGSSEFSSLGFIQVIKANAEGAALVAVATEFDLMDIQLVLSNAAVQKTGISENMPVDQKVKLLAGLRIGITSPGSTTDTYVRSLFKARGLDPDKAVQIQPMGGGSNMLAALEKGATDGFAWGAPQAHLAVTRNLGTVVINPFKGELPETAGVPYLVLVTSRQTLEQKPNLIRAAVRAFARAMKFAKENPEGARALLRQQFPDLQEALFNRIWDDYRNGIPATPVVSPEQLQKTAAWLNLTATARVNPDYAAVVWADFARAAAGEILGAK